MCCYSKLCKTCDSNSVRVAIVNYARMVSNSVSVASKFCKDGSNSVCVAIVNSARIEVTVHVLLLNSARMEVTVYVLLVILCKDESNSVHCCYSKLCKDGSNSVHCCYP